jgi:hypothetical protein
MVRGNPVWAISQLAADDLAGLAADGGGIGALLAAFHDRGHYRTDIQFQRFIKIRHVYLQTGPAFVTPQAHG